MLLSVESVFIWIKYFNLKSLYLKAFQAGVCFAIPECKGICCNEVFPLIYEAAFEGNYSFGFPDTAIYGVL
jgi:hypothetical protein